MNVLHLKIENTFNEVSETIIISRRTLHVLKARLNFDPGPYKLVEFELI